MGKSTNVAAPNPHDIAQADAYYNRIDQYTPWGSLTYGGPGRNQSFLEFNSDLQNIFRTGQENDQLMADLAQGRLENFSANPPPPMPTELATDPNDFNMRFEQTDRADYNTQANTPDRSYYDTRIDPSQFDRFDRGRFEDAFFDRGSELLNRQFDRTEEIKRQDLANRGLLSFDPEIAEGANTELGLFNQNRDEAFLNLSRDAIRYGGQEMRDDLQSQLGLALGLSGNEMQRYGQDYAAEMGLAQHEMQRYGQDYASDLGYAQDERDAYRTSVGSELQEMNLVEMARARDFNELAALLGLQQTAMPNMGSFVQPGMADVTGAYALNNQANMHNSQMNAQQNIGAMSGLFGLGSAALGNWGTIFS